MVGPPFGESPPGPGLTDEESEGALRPLYTLMPGLLTTTFGPMRPEGRRVCASCVDGGVGGETSALVVPFWVARSEVVAGAITGIS